MPNVSADASYLPGLTKYVSFVDESGHAKDPNQNYLCLAGLLATEEAWKKFDAEWRTVCAAEGLKEPFHMKDLAACRGEFTGWGEGKRRQLLGELTSAIRCARAIPIGSVVSIKGFDALPPHVRKGFKDPHFLAFQSLTYQIAVAASMEWQPGPVTMVFAHHPEHSEGLGNTGQLWQAVRKCTPIVALFMESYLCGQQAEHPGLQAADLWAYELRHHFEVIRPASQELRWPFLQFVKLGLSYDFTHDFISYYDENGLSGLGKMSQVQRWGEIDLRKPGFVGLTPTDAKRLDVALRKFAADALGKEFRFDPDSPCDEAYNGRSVRRS
jgi:hypothetical protein